MKSKTLILMAVAVVCGLAASYMTSKLLADRSEKVKILVAKKKFGPWTHLNKPDEMFEFEERAKNDVPRNAVSRPESIKDHILIKGMNQGEVVLQDNLMNKDKGGLDVQLAPGKRAVAVRTTQESSGGGFVLPGSRVDIIHTMRKGDKDPDSRVILQNVLVRAVDTMIQKPDDRPGFVPATVTVEVSPAEALILAKFKDVGAITLSLRPFGEGDNQTASSIPEPKPEPKPEVKPEPAPVKTEVVAVPPPPPPPPEKKTMLVMNGGKSTWATYSKIDGLWRMVNKEESSDEASAAPTVPPLPPPPPTPPAAPQTPAQPGAAVPRELGGTPPGRLK